MNDETLNNEIITDQIDNTAAETPLKPLADQEIATQEVPQLDSKYAIDYRSMRKSKEKVEKERDEAYKVIQELKASEKVKEEPEDDDISIGEDDLVDGKHLGKVTNKIKRLEQRIESYKRKTNEITAETQLKNKYSDFDKVVSKANVDRLVEEHPELGATIRSSTDLYSQAVTAYTMIKKMGIYNDDQFESEKLKVEQNAAKPRPLTSVSPQQGEGPLTRANAFANGLTPELKAQLRKEMAEAVKNH